MWWYLALFTIADFFGDAIAHNACCGPEIKFPLLPYIYAMPIFAIFYVVRVIKGFVKKEKSVTKRDTFNLLVLVVIAILGGVWIYNLSHNDNCCKMGIDGDTFAAEELNDNL